MTSLTITLTLLLCISIIALVLLSVKLKAARKDVDLATQIEGSEEIGETDRQMLKSVFEFGDMITREIMVPRTDMITLDSDETFAASLKLFCRSGYSRIPVVGENADEIIGVAYFKDLIDELYIKNRSESTRLNEIIREPLFVPESKPVDDLFRTLQETRQHIAIVVDEYGGVAGLVTLEDTLEEIVGDLYDEHDGANEDDIEIVKEGESVVEAVVPARHLISDVEELFGVEIEHDDIDTILGLLTKMIGRVAIRGSEAQVCGLKLEATATSGRRKRVSEVKITRTEQVGD
ncbi:MAG: hemolysin family protein [Candidatus Ancillula sp.]|jgi:CBS domain containing-hemolysin-like protein|nr:hemolysin family protein [Candidatus Ancillula sp.]